MGEVKDDWVHGAGFGCTGVQEPRDSCLAAGTSVEQAWLVDPLHQSMASCDYNNFAMKGKERWNNSNRARASSSHLFRFRALLRRFRSRGAARRKLDVIHPIFRRHQRRALGHAQ